jgi:glutamate/tyrosine decarboxylase-like PLP-dependent enzyme
VSGYGELSPGVERQVPEWLKPLVGCPNDAMGLLVSGGSAATITTLAVAGHRATARADSVALDAHRWRHVPYDAGAVLVRDADEQRAAFSLVAPYVRQDLDPDGLTWGRTLRAARVLREPADDRRRHPRARGAASPHRGRRRPRAR